MQIGVVSDPHGCLVGLKAALDWLADQGIGRVFCAGDVASFGPHPNECVALLAERCIATVQGNSDQAILLPSPVGEPASERQAQLATIDDWCREQLTPATSKWLAALPLKLAPAPELRIVHGGFRAADEILDAAARPSFPAGVSVVAAGHLHVPFVTQTEQGLWVNAGSAGRPCDGDPRAAVAVLNQRAGACRASVHRIPFDVEAAAEAIRRADMPFAERLIETQRRASWW
jgi:predicted phosphodiesterase